MRDGIISEQMKSRLIKAGLPATYEELVALAAGTGIPADILFNEEGWRQLPTYLSKANLLSDVTEIAIWENAKNRTVNDALKMLADVAYGRVASLTLTIKDTAGNPIPDVTVRLDSAPTVGEDPITGTNGTIKLDTNGGSHTLYLVYPLGYSAENAQQTIQVTGNTEITVASVSRKDESTVFTLTEAKSFYIARFLSPVQLDIRGGGGSGCCTVACYYRSTLTSNPQGGAGGYAVITGALDAAGKLIKVYPGAGGNPASATAPTAVNLQNIAAGNKGGATTVYIDGDALVADGGAGGSNSVNRNTDGGAAGGAGKDYSGSDESAVGENGKYLFNDSALARHGSGGGGAFFQYDDNSTSDSAASAGKTGGTNAISGNLTSSGRKSDDAINAGGSGAVAAYTNSTSNSAKAQSGKGGPGFVAFRKAV